MHELVQGNTQGAEDDEEESKEDSRYGRQNRTGRQNSRDNSRDIRNRRRDDSQNIKDLYSSLISQNVVDSNVKSIKDLNQVNAKTILMNGVPVLETEYKEIMEAVNHLDLPKTENDT